MAFLHLVDASRPRNIPAYSHTEQPLVVEFAPANGEVLPAS